MPPETRYAKSGEVHLAYQVVGEGPLDLVFVHGWVSNVEYAWEVPALARFLDRLASFSRLILFDRRGTGMSDRVPDRELPPLEQRMDDIRTVMDAIGSQRAAIFAISGTYCPAVSADAGPAPDWVVSTRTSRRALDRGSNPGRPLERFRRDHLPCGRHRRRPDEVEEFLTGIRRGRARSVLATVLFTDIVGALRPPWRSGTAWRNL